MIPELCCNCTRKRTKINKWTIFLPNITEKIFPILSTKQWKKFRPKKFTEILIGFYGFSRGIQLSLFYCVVLFFDWSNQRRKKHERRNNFKLREKNLLRFLLELFLIIWIARLEINKLFSVDISLKVISFDSIRRFLIYFLILTFVRSKSFPTTMFDIYLIFVLIV